MPIHRAPRVFWMSICLTLVWIAPAHTQEAWEIAAAQNAIGRLQALGERGAKQYLMFQFRIGNTTSKAPLQKNVNEFDTTLGGLQVGSRLEGIPAPPNTVIRENLDKIRADWAVLRKIYTYDPVALRRETNLIPFEEQRQDPILVKYVDRLTATLQTNLDALGGLYQEACSSAGHAACGASIREAGRQRMLTEAMAKDILMIILNVAPSQGRDRLRRNRGLFETTLEEMSAGGGAASRSSLGATMLQTIDGYWRQLKIDVDVAVGGDPDDIDIDRLLRVHRELVEEIDSFAIMAVETTKSGA